MDASKTFHASLEQKKVPHLWHVDSGATHLAGLEERPVSPGPAAVPRRQARLVTN